MKGKRRELEGHPGYVSDGIEKIASRHAYRSVIGQGLLTIVLFATVLTTWDLLLPAVGMRDMTTDSNIGLRMVRGTGGLAILGFFIWRAGRLRRREVQRLMLESNLRPACCFDCGYDLRSSAGHTCPECGCLIARPDRDRDLMGACRVGAARRPDE